MKAVRMVLLLVGVVAVLTGLVWMGQGSGYFPYPASSFMINQSPWIWYGAICAVVGIVLVVISRRVR